MKQQVISKINQTINNIYNIIKYNFHINNKNYIKFYHTVTSAGVCSSFLLLLLTLSILIPINLKGEKTIAASGDTSTTSLTLSTTSGSAELDLLVTSDSGTFASSTTPLTFSASTNNYTGYTLSIKSATSSTNLTNSTKDANNNTVTAAFTSLSSANATTKNGVTADTFNSSAYNNQWGFKPSYYNSTANSDKFYPSPDSTGVTLNRTNCANGSSNGTYTCSNATDSYTIEIGARATYAQVAGTYTNTYILSAVGNYPEYKITYNDASGESTDLPTAQEILSTDNETAKQTSISFSTTEPTRDGYEFIGWCSMNNSSDSTKCTELGGTVYDPGDTYALDLLSSNTMPLYAIWQLNKVYMQDLTLDQCKVNVGTNGNAVNIGDNITVYDRRDNSDYTVRYINGQCWMTQNLRITGTISSTDSNFTYISSFNVSEYNLTDSNNCNGYGASASNPKGYANACSHDSGSVVNGVRYNFVAATAGSIAGFGNDILATQDICPASWSLPTGPNAYRYTDLYRLVGNTSSAWQDATAGLTAFNAIASGYYNDGSLDTTYGYWWSARSDTTGGGRYRLSYNSENSQFFVGASSRSYGFSIRCVHVNAISEITTLTEATYMQDITPAVVTATIEGSVATLLDRRDTSDYTVKKINGQLWMTQNLRITGTIPSTDSNFDYINSFNVSQYNLTNKTYCNAGTSSNPSGYTYACSRLGTSITGAWYNFAAASAGTVAGYSSNVDATQDICPANWHLPTGPSTTAGTDYNKLIGNTNYGWQTTTGLTEFGAVVGGYYSAGTLTAIKTDGHWWSAAASDDNSRYRLYYDGTSGQFLADGSAGYARFYGLFIRCVAKS